MTKETTFSILRILENRGIEMHSKHDAIRSVREMEFGPDNYRSLIAQVLQMDQSAVNELVTDDEADKTLCYIVEQYFDPMGELDLTLAHSKAVNLLKDFPVVEPDPIEDDEFAPSSVNDDGVKVGKTGKPRKGYKKDMALSLYREHKDTIKDKASWVALFVEKISGMNKAVANTYIHNIETGKWLV